MGETRLPKQDNHYATLQVSPDASERVITAAYRCLVQIHHPDKNSGSRRAGEVACRINTAYAVLSDKGRRVAYDENMRMRHQAQERRAAQAECSAAAGPLKSGPATFRPFGFRPLV